MVDSVRAISNWLERELPRSGAGRTTLAYFEDMYQTLREQFMLLETTGHTVCVVANSTFSRRRKLKVDDANSGVCRY